MKRIFAVLCEVWNKIMANRKFSSLWLKYQKTCADGYANNESEIVYLKFFFLHFCDTKIIAPDKKFVAERSRKKENRNRNWWLYITIFKRIFKDLFNWPKRMKELHCLLAVQPQLKNIHFLNKEIQFCVA